MSRTTTQADRADSQHWSEPSAEEHGLEPPAKEHGQDPQTERAEPGVLRGMARGGMAVLVILVVAVSSMAFVFPRFIGAVPLAVLSGSMEPTYSPGDLVITQKVPPEDIQVGDVVTFQPESGDPTLITHRVTAKSMGASGVAAFTTQGDANGAADEPIVPEQIMGKVIYSLPYLGYLTTALGPHMKAVAASVIGVGLVGYAVIMLVTSIRTRGSSVR